MKWPFRITAALLLAVSTGVIYVYWGSDDAIPWLRGKTTPVSVDQSTSFSPKSKTKPTSHAPKKGPSDLAGEARPGNNRTLSHSLVFTDETCSFSNTQPARTNISTYKILEIINGAMSGPPDLRDGAPPMKLNSISYGDSRYKKPKNIKKQPLTVIVVPHSHSDPGWLKTLGGYFHDQTHPTLDNMVQKLMKYPNMTFVWAESVFLSMWYQDLDEKSQADVRRLIDRGQLEIVVGSWVVPDEANPHYFAIIDQMIEGHQWLEQNIGVKPTNTWSLDPFGYSSTHPYLYKRAGYENMVILRTHELVKNQLIDVHGLEFFWQQPWDQKGSTKIFTQMMPYKLYNIKHTCGPDHHVCVQFDFRKIPGEWSEARAEVITDVNVERQAKLLLGQYHKKASLFRHNVLLVPLGDDFRYDRPVEWDQQFKNYMKLFNYMNREKSLNVRARFGTVKDYFDEVRKVVPDMDTNPNSLFPSLDGDFFPYTDQNNDYWAGYFTTRPFDKNYGRELEVNLRAAEILNSLASAVGLQRKEQFSLYNKHWQKLTRARQALGLFQHHDAITGTAKSFVVRDYEGRLQGGMDSVREVISAAASYLLSESESESGLPSFSPDAPKSLRMLDPVKKVLHIDGTSPTPIVIFNTVGHSREELVRITVDSDMLVVKDEKGKGVVSQINPIWTQTPADISTTRFELVFIALLPPLSLVTYTVSDAHDMALTESMNYAAHVRLYNVHDVKVPPKTRFTVLPPQPNSETIIIENDLYRLWLSTRNGLLQTMTSKNRFKTVAVKLEFLNYLARGSGAYIFDPAGPAVDGEMSLTPVVRVIRGPITSEVHSVQELVQHSVTLCNSTGPLGTVLDINNMVDMNTLNNKEMIMRLTTDLKHHNFYTDLNGFQIAKRKRFSNFPTQANYYPMTSFAYIEDNSCRLGLISAQPLGVGSHEDGAIEVMLDRRLIYDDGRGLGEGIQDNKRAPSRFYLLLERFTKGEQKPSSAELSQPSLTAHVLANNLRNYAIVFFPNEPQSPPASLPSSVHFLQQPLPCDIQLVNLRTLPNTDDSSAKAALILHKTGFQCGFSSPPMQCDLDNKHITLNQFFQDARVTSAVEKSLSLMFDKEKLDMKTPLSLDPMELYAYVITFR